MCSPMVALHRLPFSLAVSRRFLHPGEGHEKCGVEGEGGYFRRNTGIPHTCGTLAELNAKLLVDCRHDESQIIAARTKCSNESRKPGALSRPKAVGAVGKHRVVGRVAKTSYGNK